MAGVDVDRLRDDQWERLRDLVPGGREGQRGPRCDNRLFVDALLWMARSGARWFHGRVGEAKGRMRRIMLVAMARKLVVALWRYVADGTVPEGAVLKA